MLIATFNSTTEWAGNSIGFDGDAFTVEGLGELTADEVMLFDADGQLTWVSEETRDLIAASVPVSQAVSSPPPPAQTAQATPTAPPLGTPQPAKADPSAHAPDAPPVTKNHAETEDEPGNYVLVATFAPTTGWAGKTINYDDGVFTLEGHGPISAEDVLAYDGQGHIEWAYSDLKEWAQQQASQTPGASPTAQPLPGRPATPPPRKATPAQLLQPKGKTGRVPMWLRVVIAVVVVWLCLAGLFRLLGVKLSVGASLLIWAIIIGVIVWLVLRSRRRRQEDVLPPTASLGTRWVMCEKCGGGSYPGATYCQWCAAPLTAGASQPDVLIATFGPTTGWVGKTIICDGNDFVLEGHGPISAARVMDYDGQGQLVWAGDGFQAWVSSLASSRPQAYTASVQPAASSPSAPPDPPVASAPAVAAALVGPATGAADEIAKLAGLREKGLLTDDEFAALKAKLMEGP